MSGRPKNTDSAETLARIDSAIRAEVIERPSEFSLRSVSRRAGVGVATINYYFAGRDGLLQHALRGHQKRSEAFVLESLQLWSKEDGPLVFLEKVVRRFFRFCLEEVPFQRLAEELITKQDPVGLEVAVWRGQAIQRIAGFVKQTDENQLEVHGFVDSITSLSVRYAQMNGERRAELFGQPLSNEEVEELLARMVRRIGNGYGFS